MRTERNLMRLTYQKSTTAGSLRAERSNPIFGQRLLRRFALRNDRSRPPALFRRNGRLQHEQRGWWFVLFLALVVPWWWPNGLHAEARQTLTVQMVEAVLRHHVLQQGPWQSAQVEVVVRSLPPVSLPTGPVQLQVLRPREGITPGVQSFHLAVKVEGKQIKTVWARAEIQVFDDVMVTSRALAYAEAITPADVRLERREVSALHTRTFTKLEDVDARQAARAIRVNEILTPTMVQLPQVIRPRSLVTLVYENAKLRVEAPGEAMDGGKVGDVIRVKNLSSGQLLQGQVRDSREVIIR